MAHVTTLPLEYQKLMQAKSIDTGNRCAVCGRWLPMRADVDAGPAIERHHMVFRSAAKVFDSETGEEVPKPTITLCGMGNNLRDASGQVLCHGAAHYKMLHFYWHKDSEQLEYLFTPYPTKYFRALDLPGWAQIGTRPYGRGGLTAERYPDGQAHIPY